MQAVRTADHRAKSARSAQLCAGCSAFVERSIFNCLRSNGLPEALLKSVDVCGSLLRWPTTLSSTAGPRAFSSTNGVLLLEAYPLVDRRAGRATKSEFERRAAEMRARNLEQPRFRNLQPPRSIFAPPRATLAPAKVYVRDFLREVDIKQLSQPLAAIKKLDKLETDRDGLLDLKQADLQISVSPDLLLRGVRAYDAVLKAAAERAWPLKIIMRSHHVRGMRTAPIPHRGH